MVWRMKQKGLDFGAPMEPRQARPRALTVSELTDRILGVLEVEFADVWVEGEVSNLKIAPSGHWYFSLKDAKAQVRAVVWKTDTRLIRFRPEDGMRVLARGQVRRRAASTSSRSRCSSRSARDRCSRPSRT